MAVACEAFSALAEHLLGEPRALRPLRGQATGSGFGTLSVHTLRAELATLQVLSTQQLDAICSDLLGLHDESAGRARREDVDGGELIKLDRFFETCLLGRLERLRRNFRTNCFTGGDLPVSWRALFGNTPEPEVVSAGAEYAQFRAQARRSGLAEDTMPESELRQLFDFIDEGRRGRLDPERFDDIVGMGLDRSLTTQSSAELITPLLLRIASALNKRGEEGLNALQRLQGGQATTGARRGCVPREALRQGLRQLGLPLSQVDAELLYLLLDRDSDGSVCVDQLQTAVSRCAKASLVPAELGSSTSSSLRFTPAAVDPETPHLKVHRQRTTVKRSHIISAQKAYSAGLGPRPERGSEHEQQLLRRSRSPSLIRERRSSRKSWSALDSDRSEEDEVDREYEREEIWSNRLAYLQTSDRLVLSNSDDGRATGTKSELRKLVVAAHDERLGSSELQGVAQALCDLTNVLETRTLLRNLGGIAALVDVLRRGNGSARYYAAQALATLGADGDRHQDEVAQSGAVRYLVQMLDERQWTEVTYTVDDNAHQDDACGAALECIAVIAHRHIYNATGLGQAGAIDGVVQALRKRGGLRTRSLLCLRALTDSAANRPIVAEAGSIPLLMLCSQEAAEDQDDESLAQAVSVLQSLAVTPSCQVQLVDYCVIETLEACSSTLHSRMESSTQRMVEQLSESLANERQRRTVYAIERDQEPFSNWSVEALASWVASPDEVGLPEFAQNFRQSGIDGVLLIATLRGLTEWTLVEMWQELGVELRRDQTLILNALRTREQSTNAVLSSKLIVDGATGSKQTVDPRPSSIFPPWLARGLEDIFWMQNLRAARRALRPWQRHKQLYRMILPLYILYYTIPWLLTPPPSPPSPLAPPPSPSPEIFTELVWTVVTVALMYQLQRATSMYQMCKALVVRGLQRLRTNFRSPRRYYRCVGSCPVAITLQADSTAATWSDSPYFTASNDCVGGTEVGQIEPGEVVEVLDFLVAGSTGRLRAQVTNHAGVRGWVDMVSARGLRLLEDVVTLSQERYLITVLPEKYKPGSGLLERVQDAFLVRRSLQPSRRAFPPTCTTSDERSHNDMPSEAGEDILATRASFGRGEVHLMEVLCVRAIPATADRPLENARSVNGCMVAIDRGGVSFVTKTRYAQAAGAVGVILINDTDEPLTAHGHQNLDGTVDDGADVTVPVICMRKTGGEMLVPRLPATINVREIRFKSDRSYIL